MKRRAKIIISNLVLAAILVFGTLGILGFDEVWIRAVSSGAILTAVLYTCAFHFFGFEWDLFRLRPVDHQAEPDPDAPDSLINFGPRASMVNESGRRIQGTDNCLNYARPRVYEGPRRCGKVAAALHAHLCEDESHGYSRGAHRWGISGEFCGVMVDGIEYFVNKGERDNSSSVIECWRRAIAGTNYEGALDTATYTGNMKHVFLHSGLFDWVPFEGFEAAEGKTALEAQWVQPQAGDIFLNEVFHTAMCQRAQVADEELGEAPTAASIRLSEFVINELGTLEGGEFGDQTGKESWIRSYYDLPWDGMLVYNGKADGDFEEDAWEDESEALAADDDAEPEFDPEIGDESEA